MEKTQFLRASRHLPFLSPVSDRLTELQRQRALVQEQLSWLEREIARETGQPAAPSALPASSVRVPTPLTPAMAQPALPPEAARAADEIIAQYQHEAGTGVQDVKRGCYLYFFLALGLMTVCALGAYFVYTRGR
jgi:hypothetical protein